jgi:hypothetical protein
MIVCGGILRSLAKKVPNYATGNILDIHYAFPEIGIVDRLECFTILPGYL